MQETNRLTQGSIMGSLVRFAVPFLVANLIQALYGAVDTAVVGWFCNTAGVSAVSIGSQMMHIVNSLATGLSMGGTILVAQYIGAEKHEDTQHTIATMMTMALLLALGLMVVMMALCVPILHALQTPPEAFAEATRYAYVCLGGMVFIFGYNIISALLRGMGDSKSPLIFIAVACGTNVALDLLMVGVWGMGAAGAALATVLSQAVSVVLAILYLRKHRFPFDFHPKSFRIDKDKLRTIIRLGLPVALQDSMVTLSFLIIGAIVNAMGVVASAAVGIAGKFDAFAMLPATAFSGAISAMAGQNMGAGQPKRAQRILRMGIVLSLVPALAFFVWGQLSPASILALFKADEQVIQAGCEYIRAFSIDFILVAFVFCMNGFLNGCGRTTFTMVTGLTSTFLLRVPLAFLLSRTASSSLFGVGLAAPAASLLSIVVNLIYLRAGRWKRELV